LFPRTDNTAPTSRSYDVHCDYVDYYKCCFNMYFIKISANKSGCYLSTNFSNNIKNTEK